MAIEVKKPRKTSKNNRKQQIVEAATEIISLRGYFGFSIQEVADKCNLTVAGVLHYCKTKDNLLVQVLKERERLEIEAITAFTGVGDIENVRNLSIEQICRMLRILVEQSSKQPNIVRLFSILRSEALYVEHPAYQYFIEHDAKFDKLAISFEGKIENPLSVARTLMATMSGLEILWLRFPDKIDLIHEWDQAVERILGIKAPLG